MFAGLITAPSRIELIDTENATLPSASTDGGGQILFRPQLGCLCGSDMPFFEQTGEFEVELGHSLHEIIGTVVATNGRKFQEGDSVLAVPDNQLGMFEQFVVGEDRAIALDARAPIEQALMAQPLGTVICALKKLPGVLDQDVVVVGQGPIGQLYNASLRNLGARQVIGIDPLGERLRHSASLGATSTICSSETDPIQAVADLTDGRMADIVVEAVGHREQALNLCIDLCRKYGKILYFGVPPETINGIRWRDMLVKNLSVHTSIHPDFERDFPLAMQWIGEGRVDLTNLITHRYPVAEIQKAFETFGQRVEGALKVLVDFPEAGA
ncbi:MAG: zinc-binding dehydrogenase [Planctomycetota bacterium]|nr:zinc-binding dehydrogenase [Planctomycetota bacterium]